MNTRVLTGPVALLALLVPPLVYADAPEPAPPVEAAPAPAATAPPAAAVPAATPAPVAARQAPPLAAFSIDYEISFLAFNADATVQLSPAPAAATWVYEVTSKPRGLARMIRSSAASERAEFRVTEGGIRPGSYELRDESAGDDNDTTVRFDWDRGVAESVYEGEQVTLDIGPGVYDRLSADVMAILALREGRDPPDFSVTERNQVRPYTYTDQGTETIEVPAGTFTTRKFLRQRDGSSRSTLIWFAADSGWLPVRIEQLKRGKTNVRMVATRVSNGD